MSSERRYDPLSDRWVVVSRGRLQRPWQGERVSAAAANVAPYDAGCYLCPGNARSNGARNPPYRGPFAFANDFPALTPGATESPNQPAAGPHAHSLFRYMRVTGECRVLCFHHDHHRHFATMAAPEVVAVMRAWREQWQELSKRWSWVQLFENRGAAMGASSPHPHGQIWASDTLPSEVAREDVRQASYFEIHKQRLLDDYVKEELRQQARVIYRNDDWVVLVPYWAVWPFETMLASTQGIASFNGCGESEDASLGDAISKLAGAYDRLFDVPFPYSMGWHGREQPHWTLHAHFYPPLLRGAEVRKHMVGYEMLAEAQRDLSPEEAAQRIRESLARS